MRQCVGCRQMKDKRQMIRVLRDSEGLAVIDPTGKKNGRGAYLCRSVECLSKARTGRALERSLKTDISAEIYETLEKELAELDTK